MFILMKPWNLSPKYARTKKSQNMWINIYNEKLQFSIPYGESWLHIIYEGFISGGRLMILTKDETLHVCGCHNIVIPKLGLDFGLGFSLDPPFHPQLLVIFEANKWWWKWISNIET